MFQPERLREAMFKARVNTSELARRSGINRNTIGGLLEGKGNPRSSTLEALARHLNTTPGFFYDSVAQYIERDTAAS